MYFIVTDFFHMTQNQWTALHWAADRSQSEVVRVLLKAGVDPLIPGRVSKIDYLALNFYCKSRY